MATATAEHPQKADTKKEETEKEKADKAQAEFYKENPSTLPVPPQKTAVDELRDNGVAVNEFYTAPLPGGGPSTQPGMSAGGHVPDKAEVQKQVDEDSKELQKKQEKERQEKEKSKK